MRRRTFIGLATGGAASVWTPAAWAQVSSMPVIGYLSGQSINARASYDRAFHTGLASQGFREGRNVTIEYRSADGDPRKLDALASDLVQRSVAVIAATGGPLSGLAAKRATGQIPIVFTSGLMDPVDAGLVASINRPGGNLTGVYFLVGDLVAKRLALMKELLPQMTRVAVLGNPRSSTATPTVARHIEAAAGLLGVRLETFEASSRGELSSLFERLSATRPDALFVIPDPYFTALRTDFATLSQRHRIPVSYGNREYVVSGGLMSYGPDIADSYRQVGEYVGRILKGVKPADLPVVQPTRYELVLNLKTARALDLAVPDKLLTLADEVIE